MGKLLIGKTRSEEERRKHGHQAGRGGGRGGRGPWQQREGRGGPWQGPGYRNIGLRSPMGGGGRGRGGRGPPGLPSPGPLLPGIPPLPRPFVPQREVMLGGMRPPMAIPPHLPLLIAPPPAPEPPPPPVSLTIPYKSLHSCSSCRFACASWSSLRCKLGAASWTLLIWLISLAHSQPYSRTFSRATLEAMSYDYVPDSDLTVRLQQLTAYVKPETQEVAVKFKQTEIMKVGGLHSGLRRHRFLTHCQAICNAVSSLSSSMLCPCAASTRARAS